MELQSGVKIVAHVRFPDMIYIYICTLAVKVLGILLRESTEKSGLQVVKKADFYLELMKNQIKKSR